MAERRLAEAFQTALEGIQLPKPWQDLALKAVKESFALERNDHASQLTKLQDQYQKLKDRMDGAYEDKLDGRISQELFDKKYQDWCKEQDLVVRKIDALRHAGRHFIEDSKTILELAEAASDLYKRQNEAEKRCLLEIVFSNSLWKGGKLIPVYREPFAHLASARMSLVGTEGLDGTVEGQEKRILPRLDSNQ